MNVLFVCLGNICRSPSAEGVFRHVLDNASMINQVSVDSCGIGSWHVGKAPDQRAQAAAKQRGIDISALRARQFAADDFARFDYILAMDHDNLQAIRAMQPEVYAGHVGLLLDFAGQADAEVPDPYYGGDQGFEEVLDLIESASRGLLNHIRSRA
ncbi:low molecular weight phosphotyrosine protein phosphatase [Halomonas vilamensis]|uniref:protein-tyrosine-phosphatase n=1 Tax=Vreelandella vilamensis TaxID=531309 RepID=A0ABU1H2F9_9GAMM|nr:low molecular weight protein-tyrosine-phosphatase [Halomonas vilamensis]MDR5898041.1 low molecular weight phosphotyrosine protein phosphatase [Halomonas vilamensis]